MVVSFYQRADAFLFGRRTLCVQGSCDLVIARIFGRGASPLLCAPVAGEELVGKRRRVG
jgi:hypothetical protein